MQLEVYTRPVSGGGGGVQEFPQHPPPPWTEGPLGKKTIINWNKLFTSKATSHLLYFIDIFAAMLPLLGIMHGLWCQTSSMGVLLIKILFVMRITIIVTYQHQLWMLTCMKIIFHSPIPITTLTLFVIYTAIMIKVATNIHCFTKLGSRGGGGGGGAPPLFSATFSNKEIENNCH